MGVARGGKLPFAANARTAVLRRERPFQSWVDCGGFNDVRETYSREIENLEKVVWV